MWRLTEDPTLKWLLLGRRCCEHGVYYKVRCPWECERGERLEMRQQECVTRRSVLYLKRWHWISNSVSCAHAGTWALHCIFKYFHKRTVYLGLVYEIVQYLVISNSFLIYYLCYFWLCSLVGFPGYAAGPLWWCYTGYSSCGNTLVAEHGSGGRSLGYCGRGLRSCASQAQSAGSIAVVCGPDHSLCPGFGRWILYQSKASQHFSRLKLAPRPGRAYRDYYVASLLPALH